MCSFMCRLESRNYRALGICLNANEAFDGLPRQAASMCRLRTQWIRLRIHKLLYSFKFQSDTGLLIVSKNFSDNCVDDDSHFPNEKQSHSENEI